MCAKALQPCPTLCDPTGLQPASSSVHGDSPGKNTGISCHALLQGIVPAQEWNTPPGDLPNPGIEPRSPALQVDSLPSEPPRKPKYTIPSPGELPDPGIKLWSPALQADSLPAELPGKPQLYLTPKSVWVHYTARLPKQDWLYKCAFASAILILT